MPDLVNGISLVRGLAARAWYRRAVTGGYKVRYRYGHIESEASCRGVLKAVDGAGKIERSQQRHLDLMCMSGPEFHLFVFYLYCSLR